MIAAPVLVVLGFFRVSANAQLLLPGTACLLNTCGPADGFVSTECNADCVLGGYPNGTCTVTLIDHGSTAISNCTCNGDRNTTLPNVEESMCDKAACEQTCLSCGYQNTDCVKNPALNGGGCVCTNPKPNSLLGLLLRLLGILG